MAHEAAVNYPNVHRRPWALRNLTRTLALACLISFAVLCLLFLAPIPPHHQPHFPPLFHHGHDGPPHHHPPPPPPIPPRPDTPPQQDASRPAEDPAQAPHPGFTPCVGPRGVMVKQGQDIPLPVYELPNINFTVPMIGSHEAVGMRPSWLTAQARYGPYGYGEDDADYAFQRVNWTDVNWGRLQHDCVVSNRNGLPGRDDSSFERAPRFRFTSHGEDPRPPRTETGRQAIVLRAWSTFKYTPEDLWSIRAMIAEANLGTGGRFEVILLVDVKDKQKGPYIHRDDALYREVLEASVPAEFRDLAVLFHPTLQEDWYAKVKEFKPIWQIMQPLQLLAHFYPEYDHFWQIELDTRITGDVGEMFSAFDTFSRGQPYKQSAERASWAYMPIVHGEYSDMCKAINKSLGGGATTWGPVRIKNFEPMFDAPPMKPKEDDFEWGVGSDADLLLFTSLNDVNRIEHDDDWVFKQWYSREFDKDVPRWLSAPAQARGSWRLLESVHTIQRDLGLRMPSEATLPSWAMWNGMKIVALPHPTYQFPQRDRWEMNKILNGKFPAAYKDGIANGPARYSSSLVAFFVRPQTWAWWSSLPDPTFEWWFGRTPKRQGRTLAAPQVTRPEPPPVLPDFMANVSGAIYAPQMMLHPRKTNSYISP